MFIKKSALLYIFYSIMSIVFANDSIDTKEAQTLAISSDYAFITAFVTDFGINYDKYTSYMAENNMEFPNSIMNFYNRLNTFTESSLVPSILPDIFPFTAFYTFVNVFPWYSSLLEEGGITKFYLPSDITATDSNDITSSSLTTTTASQSSTAKIVSMTSIFSSSASTVTPTTTATASSLISKVESSSTSLETVSTASEPPSKDGAAQLVAYFSPALILSFIAILL